MKKKQTITSLLILSLGIIGIISGLALVRRSQEIRKKAAAATTIYLEPSSSTANVNQTVNLDILVNTSENHLATLRLEINYEPVILQPLSLNFTSLLPQSLRSINLSIPGKITGSAGVALETSVHGTGQKVAELSFRVISEAPQGTTIDFGPDTSAYSALTTELMDLNLITSKVSAQITALVPTPTPTPSPSPTPIPQPTATPIPTNTPTPTPTPSPIPTNTPTPTPLIGDLDSDGDVDEVDYSILLMNFGKEGEPGIIVGDIYQDGVVDEIDYAALIANFGIGIE